MKMYGQAEVVAQRILTIFEHPELLPAAVAPVFIHSKADIPCNAWSWRNRVLCALAGTADARGFQQWKEVGRKGGAYGYFTLNRNTIALGVYNLSTFLHELVHAADYRLGALVERGQHWRSETVAEFSAATLAACLDLDATAIDIGGAYSYVKCYAETAGKTPTAAAIDCLDRICRALDLILTTAEEIAAAAAPVARAA